MLGAESFVLYDGESATTNADSRDGGPKFEAGGGLGKNSLEDASTDPHSGKFCGRWTYGEEGSNATFIVDPTWMGIPIDNVTGLEFWARGEKGGEGLILSLCDRKKGRPKEGDGFFSPVALKGISKAWKKYSVPLAVLRKVPAGQRPLEMDIFLGFELRGPKAGETVYLDDVKFLAKPREEIIYAPIKLNQLGYRPGDAKTAVLNSAAETFQVVEALGGKPAFQGKAEFVTKFDPESGDPVSWADFSGLTLTGKYRIVLPGGLKSAAFEISETVYDGFFRDMLRVFYYQRCGVELDQGHGGAFTHARCHADDVRAEFAKRGDGTRPAGALDVSGGWHDAGDNNKYSHPIYATLWYLVRAQELFPAKFKDGLLGIPESGNGVADLVDEVRWELDWYLKMQVKEGPEAGMVYSKAGASEAGGKKPKRPYMDDLRYVFEPTTSDTIGFAAATAMLSGFLARQADEGSRALAATCREAALKAWEAYVKSSQDGTRQIPEGGFKNPEGWGGSTAMGNPLAHEQKQMFNAACELYRLTKEARFHEVVKSRLEGYLGLLEGRDPLWGQDEFLGFFSYCSLPEEETDAASVAKMKARVRRYREDVKKYMATTAYRIPLGQVGHFCWGSNSDVLKNGAIFHQLYLWDGREEDLRLARRSFDYVMGLNAVDTFMFTGWGKGRLMYHGVWESSDPEKLPPGYMVGGVDKGDGNGWMSRYPQKCYRDSMNNWSVNEGAIYYQSSAVYVAAIFAP